jgi:hypothetical protein
LGSTHTISMHKPATPTRLACFMVLVPRGVNKPGEMNHGAQTKFQSVTKWFPLESTAFTFNPYLVNLLVGLSFSF